MRLIGKEEIENMAIGAALLGTGGGGDPYIGKLMALQAIEKYGPVKLSDENKEHAAHGTVPVQDHADKALISAATRHRFKIDLHQNDDDDDG